MVQHPLKSADAVVASCSQPEHQRDVICFLGFASCPPFSLKPCQRQLGLELEQRESSSFVLLVPCREGSFLEDLGLSFLRDRGTKPMQRGGFRSTGAGSFFDTAFGWQ